MLSDTASHLIHSVTVEASSSYSVLEGSSILLNKWRFIDEETEAQKPVQADAVSLGQSLALDFRSANSIIRWRIWDQ